MVIGYDPAIPAYATLPEGHFDMIVANDVFEHFDPDELDEELKLINDKCDILFANISCRPATQNLPDGRNAHTCLMSFQEWIAVLLRIFSNSKITIHYEYHPGNRNFAVCMVDKKLLTNH